MGRKDRKSQQKGDAGGSKPRGHFDNDHNPVIGIDLGTTYSCCARWDGRNPDVYQGLDKVSGSPELRSVVYQEEGGNIVVGQAAYSKYLQDPENGALEIKREMGNGSHRAIIRGKEYTPAEISSFILRKIRDELYDRFPAGKFDLNGVVVTHPFYFKGPQIEDTRKAAEMADLNILALLPEPVAAAMAYTLYYFKDHLEPEKPETILVFDLGGGTFDTTLFELKDTRDELIFKGLSTGGDAKLGGMDFNRALRDYLLRQEGLDLAVLTGREGLRARVRLEEATEVVKRDLAVLDTAFLAVNDILPGRHITRDITRSDFERVFCGEEGGRNFYDDIAEIVRETIRKAANAKVDKVLLVGGSTRIPIIRNRLIPEELSGAEIYSNISESQAVALGASIFAAIQDHRLEYRNIQITIPGAHDFGIRTHAGRFAKIINNNAPLPAIYSQTFITPEENTRMLSFEVFERDGGYTGDRIDDGIRLGKIVRRGRIDIGDLPPHRKGEIEALVRLTVAKSEQVSVHIEVFHNKKKIRETDEDLRK